MAFENKDEAMVWMIDNQRGRRNLKPGQLAELGLKRASILEERAKENQMAGLMQGTEKPVSLTLDKREQIDTLQSAADYSGLSRATIAKAKKVFAEAPEKIKEEVRTGKTSINKAYQEVKKPRTAAGK